MMNKTSLALLLLMALATPAQALKLVVWDPELKNKVAYGESIGGKFNVKYDKSYEGPVIALFSQTDEEKARGTYASLKSSYEGVLRDGQLVLNTEDTPGRGMGYAASNKALLSLNKLLSPFKLNVSVQPTSQLLPLSNSLMVRGSQQSDDS